MILTFTIPFPAKPKERPRFASTGTYNRVEYTKWKADVRMLAMDAARKAGWEMNTKSPIKMSLDILPTSFRVTLETMTFTLRTGRSDLDNLIGGIADALQPAKIKGKLKGKVVGPGIYADDKQIEYVSAAFRSQL